MRIYATSWEDHALNKPKNMSHKGLVVTPPMVEIDGGFKLKRTIPDRAYLKRYFTYWDEVVIVEPIFGDNTRFIGIGDLCEQNDDDINVANEEGLLRKQPVKAREGTFSSEEVPKLYQEAQRDAATYLNRERDGYWSLGQTVDRLQLPEEETVRKDVFKTELVEALPAPASDVSTRKILRFRDQYSDPLKKFQARYHELYSTIQSHPNQKLAITNAIDELEVALEDLHDVMEEEGFRPRRVSLDTLWEVSRDAAIAGLTTLGAGASPAVSLAFAAGSAAISLEVSSESKPTSWPDDLEDYAYLYHVDRELGD